MIRKFNKAMLDLTAILNDGQFHAGDHLGERLGLTRSAIWKMIKKLKRFGIQIESVHGKGYLLREQLILLDGKKIKKNLDKEIELTLFESIPSTNDFFNSAKKNKGIKICLAEQQTAGKGRLNRHWCSPYAQNIYFSCYYTFQKDVSELGGLSLLVSLATRKTLRDFNIDEELCVKWPNDILYQNKKLSGTLIHIHAETHGLSHAIIGIGINVNLLVDDGLIAQGWTSMRKILGCYIDRNILCERLIQNLLAYLAQFADKGFAGFMDEWRDADALARRAITINAFHEKVAGEVMGVNTQGQLLMRLPDDSVRAFSSGDTTIIKSS